MTIEAASSAPATPCSRTRASYIAGCRCDACTLANKVWVKSYRYRAAQAGGSTRIPVEERVRPHLHKLLEHMSMTSVAAASGVDRSTLRGVRDGKLKRISPKNALGILRTRIDSPSGTHWVDARGARRRCQALVALGWSIAKVAEITGYSYGNMKLLVFGKKTQIVSDVDQRIRAAYEHACMTLPPERDSHEKGAATKARALASRRGWTPPLGWDDIDRDRERPTRAAEPDVADEAVVERVLAGEWNLPTTEADRIDVFLRWQGSQNDLERLTGWNLQRIRKAAA